MYLKNCWKYTIYFFISLFIIGLFITNSHLQTINNETTYITFSIFKIYDWGSAVALIVGILAFFVSLYNTDKNYKAMKLSSIPDNSTNLLIDLEYAFNEYELCKIEKRQDEFILLTEILKYWKDHQKALRLLTPNFYKKFLKIMSTQENIDEKDDVSTKNSKYVLMAIKSQITNIAFEHESNMFSFIRPEIINDNITVKQQGDDILNYTEFKINKNNFDKYIHKIGSKDNNGENTKKETIKKYKKLNKDIGRLLVDLKREIEEYN